MSFPKNWRQAREDWLKVRLDERMPKNVIGIDTGTGRDFTAIHVRRTGGGLEFATVTKEQIEEVGKVLGDIHREAQCDLYSSMLGPAAGRIHISEETKDMTAKDFVPFKETAIGKAIAEVSSKYGPPPPRKATIWDVHPIEGKVDQHGIVFSPKDAQAGLGANTIVKVVTSREYATDRLLVLTPQEVTIGLPARYAPHAPNPSEPTSQHMERLASAIDLPIDGYMTWDGIVGFVEEEISKLKDQRRRAHESARKWEAEAQRERHRANQAADAAGNANHQMKVNTRSDGDIITAQARQIAELKLELRELRKKR